MSDKDIFKSMLAFSKAYCDALKPLNTRTMSFFASDSIANALKSLSSATKVSSPKSIIAPGFLQELDSISHSYTELMGANKFGTTISDSLKAVVADLQVSTMFQLSQSYQTPMIHDLAACFTNAQYSGLVDVLNSSLARMRIEAPDIAFIKTSKLVDTLKDELLYPRGFSSSIKTLNRSTAEGIADSSEIFYDTGLMIRTHMG